jgi:hypothetical protein
MDQKALHQYIKANFPSLAEILHSGPAPKATLRRQAPLPVHPKEGGELDFTLLFSGYPQDAIQIGNKENKES